ncbi:MAG: helix-turn-helix transcriptional regulator [Ruminococcus flavefaciens]|nr:helix-turn-helix transcriptional regulator [Ruminococcus flavefaciens]
MPGYDPCLARALRLRYKISLSELAQAAGVSVQLISKIELEPERQTPAHEKMLRDAFAGIIVRRRAQLNALEKELAERGGLFQTVRGDEYGI